MKSELPVLTTVIYLFPPGPTGEPAFRVMLGAREMNVRRFELLRLWKVDVAHARAA